MIGSLLGIPNEELNIIEAGYPINVKWCCNKMLEKWLEIDHTASLERIRAVIGLPAVSGASFENGNHICMNYIYVANSILYQPCQW